MSPRFAKRQRGAIGLMAALTLAVALAFGLLVADGGRLYMEQRNLQRVVDMAALEAAGQSARCTGSGVQAAALANAAAARNGFSVGNGNTLVTNCGKVATGASSLRGFTVDASIAEAIRVAGSTTVSSSFAAGIRDLMAGRNLSSTTVLHAQAVATAIPKAMLRLRSTLATMDTQKSVLLNALLDPLGGRISLDAVGWQGIANTDIKLLDFLDQLAIDVNVGAGHYDELLAKKITATKLIQAAATVLAQSSAAADVVTNLGRIVVGADNSTLIQLGDILDLQNGTAAAGLDASLKVIDLIQATALLAAKNSAAIVQIPLNLLGLVSGTIRLKVIEPEQLSAVGNPATDDIEVHTAQVHALVSLNLPILNTLTGLTNAVLSLASPLTTLINNLLSLNLNGTLQSLGCALGVPCKVSDIKLMPGVQSIQIGLEIAQASSKVSDYSCTPNKQLTAATKSSALHVAVGTFNPPEAFFNDGVTSVKAIPLIDFGTNVCTSILGLGTSCGTRVPLVGGGVGFVINTHVLSSSTNPDAANDVVFSGEYAPPGLSQRAVYKTATSNLNLVSSLNGTLTGVELLTYKPMGSNPLGEVVTSATSLLTTVKNILLPQLTTLLGRLADPLINSLLKVLGIDLMVVDVGVNMDCGRAQLVI
ncbi:pilus assembly protein TadG-related protein [Pseudomonas japonica]|uniref:pilus assembly protein TadG-related protein n=1 Tax=Pseudomonas japonica TaxID=256466 RepID=UPI0005A8696E|nr:pilus assembly protein TadG-related protein [Pseudomonas japonica]